QPGVAVTRLVVGDAAAVLVQAIARDVKRPRVNRWVAILAVPLVVGVAVPVVVDGVLPTQRALAAGVGGALVAARRLDHADAGRVPSPRTARRSRRADLVHAAARRGGAHAGDARGGVAATTGPGTRPTHGRAGGGAAVGGDDDVVDAPAALS